MMTIPTHPMSIERLGAVMAAIAMIVLAGSGSLIVNAQETSQSSIVTTESGQTELSTSELERARSWSLDATEWRRYRSLMQGIRGSVSPATLSPIEVLGIHARDAAERRDYAERWAMAMHEDAIRILAFQRAYDTATAKLYPGQKLIDTTVLQPQHDLVTDLRPDDRILLRISPACPSCDAVVRKALGRISDVDGIDIVVKDDRESAEASVQAWAAAQGIEAEWVHSRRVTLNIDTVAVTAPDVDRPSPELFVRRGEQLLPLAYAAL